MGALGSAEAGLEAGLAGSAGRLWSTLGLGLGLGRGQGFGEQVVREMKGAEPLRPEAGTRVSQGPASQT